MRSRPSSLDLNPPWQGSCRYEGVKDLGRYDRGMTSGPQRMHDVVQDDIGYAAQKSKLTLDLRGGA